MELVFLLIEIPPGNKCITVMLSLYEYECTCMILRISCDLIINAEIKKDKSKHKSTISVEVTYYIEILARKHLNPFVATITDVNVTISTDSYSIGTLKLTNGWSTRSKAMHKITIFVED